jgi:iron complex transport system substrate-binding protein
MRGRLFFGFLFFYICLSTPFGCSSIHAQSNQQTGTSARTKMITITDMAGRRVTLPSPEYIKRVAIQTSPQVLEAYAIGIQDKLCAVTNSVKMWKTLTKVDPRLANVPATRSTNAQINIEALLQTNPDVCIGGDMDMQVIEAVTSLPTLHITQGTPGAYFEQLKKEMSFFGLVFGKAARAKVFNEYLDKLQATIRSATADLKPEKKLKVFMGYDADHLVTYGGNTFMNEWIEVAGCVNAAKSISSLGGKEGGLTNISMEQVLAWDPDIIVIDNGNPADLYKDAVWSRLSAVKNKRVYRLPVGVFIWNRPSCEAGAMLPEWLAFMAYPNRFKNMDIKSEVKRFYSDVFRFKFTDEDVRKILSPDGSNDMKR